MFRYLEDWYKKKAYHITAIVASVLLAFFGIAGIVQANRATCTVTAHFEDLTQDENTYPLYNVSYTYCFDFPGSWGIKFVAPLEKYDVRVKTVLYGDGKAEKTLKTKNAYFVNLYESDCDGKTFDSATAEVTGCTLKLRAGLPLYALIAVGLFFGVPSAVRLAQIVREENGCKKR